MEAQKQAWFDTAAFEDLLVEGGIEKDQARVHRLAIQGVIGSVTQNIATTQRLELMESKIETAISNQTIAMQRELRDQTNKYLAWTISAVTLVMAIATAIIKLA